MAVINRIDMRNYIYRLVDQLGKPVFSAVYVRTRKSLKNRHRHI